MDVREFTEQGQRNPGLDLLKAAMAILILIRHSGLFIAGIDPGSPIGTLDWIWLTYLNVLSIEVPTFMIISLYLFTQKRLNNKSYFSVRLIRIFEIIAFWWIPYLLVGLLSSYPIFSKSFLGLALFPVFDGALYFLSSLAFQLVVLELLMRVIAKAGSHRKVYSFCFVILGAVLSIVMGKLFGGDPGLIGRMVGLGPFSFVLYAPMVLFFFEEEERGLIILGVLGLILTFLNSYDSFFSESDTARALVNIFKISYSSPLAPWGGLLLVKLFINKKSMNPRFVSLGAKYGLGVYLIHPLVIALLSGVQDSKRLVFTVAGGMVSFNPFFVVLVAAISFWIIWVMSKSGFEKYVK